MYSFVIFLIHISNISAQDQPSPEGKADSIPIPSKGRTIIEYNKDGSVKSPSIKGRTIIEYNKDGSVKSPSIKGRTIIEYNKDGSVKNPSIKGRTIIEYNEDGSVKSPSITDGCSEEFQKIFDFLRGCEVTYDKSSITCSNGIYRLDTSVNNNDRGFIRKILDSIMPGQQNDEENSGSAR